MIIFLIVVEEFPLKGTIFKGTNNISKDGLWSPMSLMGRVSASMVELALSPALVLELAFELILSNGVSIAFELALALGIP